MNPFTNMAAVLTAHTAAPWNESEPPAKGLNRTDRIRCLLKTSCRPVTAAEIAFDMGDEFPNFGSHLVWLLMKYDISKGRVILDAGRYSWNHDYDTAEAKEVRAAVKLLKKKGYLVTAPSV